MRRTFGMRNEIPVGINYAGGSETNVAEHRDVKLGAVVGAKQAGKGVGVKQHSLNMLLGTAPPPSPLTMPRGVNSAQAFLSLSRVRMVFINS